MIVGMWLRAFVGIIIVWVPLCETAQYIVWVLFSFTTKHNKVPIQCLSLYMFFQISLHTHSFLPRTLPLSHSPTRCFLTLFLGTRDCNSLLVCSSSVHPTLLVWRKIAILTIDWTDIKFGSDVHRPQTMGPNNFDFSFSFSSFLIL